jgi:hypothetical protein
MPKNFLVMREEGAVEPISNCVKLQLDLEYSSLTAADPEISPYFTFDGRYVFAPYSQLKVTQVDAENQVKVIHLSLIADNHFLKQ